MKKIQTLKLKKKVAWINIMLMYNVYFNFLQALKIKISQVPQCQLKLFKEMANPPQMFKKWWMRR